MYNYRINFRYKTANSTSSGFTQGTLEFTYPKYISRDGAGEWKNTVKNIIQTNQAISASSILNDGFELKELGKVKTSESNKSSSSSSSNDESKANAERERRAEKAEKMERNAIKEERQRLIDIEEDKIHAEKQARERAERKKRADELRSQGKNFQAFILEFQNGVVGLSLVLGIAIFFFFFIQNDNSNKVDAMKINSELELIEDSVKICINNKNFDKALELVNKLVHNSHEDMEHLEFDSWNGYPKFDEYWNNKREEYKKIIFSNGSLNLDESNLENQNYEKPDQSANEDNSIDNNEQIQNENVEINQEEVLNDE